LRTLPKRREGLQSCSSAKFSIWWLDLSSSLTSLSLSPFLLVSMQSFSIT
jgi:hypothetical protein